jgi:hypothetical protein
MPEQSAKPLTEELERAFYHAVCECKDWANEPDREPEVYVDPDRLTRHKVSAVCTMILAHDNKPLPREVFDIVYRIPDATRTDLKRSFDGDETYHAGAHCLLEWVKHKRRRS